MDARNTLNDTLSGYLDNGQFNQFFSLIKNSKAELGSDIANMATDFLNHPRATVSKNEARVDAFIKAMRDKVDPKTANEWELKLGYAYFFRDEATTRLERALDVKREKYHEYKKPHNIDLIDSILDDLEKLEKKLGGLEKLGDVVSKVSKIEQLTSDPALIAEYLKMENRALLLRRAYVEEKESNPVNYRQRIKAALSSALDVEYQRAMNTIQTLLTEFNENLFLTPVFLKIYETQIYDPKILLGTSMVCAYTDEFMRANNISLDFNEQEDQRAAHRIHLGIEKFNTLKGFSVEIKKILYRDPADELLITPLELPVELTSDLTRILVVEPIDDAVSIEPYIITVGPLGPEEESVNLQPLETDEEVVNMFPEDGYSSDIESDNDSEMGNRDQQRRSKLSRHRSDSEASELGHGSDSEKEELSNPNEKRMHPRRTNNKKGNESESESESESELENPPPDKKAEIAAEKARLAAEKAKIRHSTMFNTGSKDPEVDHSHNHEVNAPRTPNGRKK